MLKSALKLAHQPLTVALAVGADAVLRSPEHRPEQLGVLGVEGLVVPRAPSRHGEGGAWSDSRVSGHCDAKWTAQDRPLPRISIRFGWRPRQGSLTSMMSAVLASRRTR